MKLRRNHTSSGNNSLSFIVRVIIFIGLLLGILYFLLKNKDNILQYIGKDKKYIENNDFVYERTYLPVSDGIILHKSNFSLAYDSNCKSAKWVAYRLTKDQLKDRIDLDRVLFSSDPQLKRNKTEYYDYSGSGYDRGHLVPAADMSFDSISYKETFLMSNIVPQKRGCNRGIWKELEKQTRQWVKKHNEVYIISGPVYTQQIRPVKLNKSNICVPDAFFKIVLVYNDKIQATLSFVVPNELSDKSLSSYTSTIREIEKQTGINFFDHMLDDSVEEKLENSVNPDLFPLQKNLYKQRVESWNFE